MFATLQAKLTLVSVADSIVSANRLKFRRTGWTLANRRPTDFRANRAPLADLRQNSNSNFPISPSPFSRSTEKREINRGGSRRCLFFFLSSFSTPRRQRLLCRKFPPPRKPDNLSSAIFYRHARHFNSRDSTSLCSDFPPYSSLPRPANRLSNGLRN